MEQWAESTTFGPTSEPIRIKEFLEKSVGAQKRISSILEAFEVALMNVCENDDEYFEPIPKNLKPVIEAECGYVIRSLNDDHLLNFP